MIETWNRDISYEFLLYKIIMWPLGLWPLNRGRIFSDIRLVIAALTQAATSICLTSEILSNCNGFENALDLLVLDIFASLACAKGIIVRIHQADICSNVISAFKDWCGSAIIENTKYREIMLKHARIGRIVCYSLMGPASGGTLSWIIFALPLPMFTYGTNGTEVMRNFPLQTACTLESVTNNFILYWGIFALQVVQLVATCLGNCGNDVFFFGIAMHVCGQFEILRMQISTIAVDNNTDETVTRKRLVDLAERHSHLVDLVDKLENTFHLIILAQLLMSALLICIMGVQVIIALKTDDAFTGIKASIVLSSLMSQLFLYSYGGDYLTSQNEKLGYAVYENSWFNLTPKTVKDLIFMMMRAGKPIRVTAGKFFIMTLGTFMDILKISVSYMSFLRVMIDV
ncbi:odorant receptor 22c-like [Venturia canescens]|uniref:odorant receptor 22c-like n=1 Tax=Venturia canescens TaxID=32260 RepID=UPI001C9C85E5|nr:odorant receptor 22c-like [Venturia canescens]